MCAVLILGACDREREAPPSSESSAAVVRPSEPSAPAPANKPAEAAKPDRVEACSVVLSGATDKKIVGLVSLDPRTSPNTDTSVATEYWLTAAERESAQRLFEKATGVKRRPGAAAMLTLTLNCGDEHGAISLMPRGLSTTDLPRGPGKYAILSNRPAPAAKGFQTVINAKDDELYEAVGGELSITHFDERHLAGTFHVEAQGRLKKKSLILDGKFDFPCQAQVGNACSK